MAAVNDKPVQTPAEPEATNDPAGIIGILISAAAIVNLLLGILIPVGPWVLSGIFAIVLLICAGWSKTRPLRMWNLLIGILCLIPPLIFGVIQLWLSRNV